MTAYVSIAAFFTVTVTAVLIKFLFFSGRTLTNATFFGRLVSRIDPARRAFADGWRKQSWGYLIIAYPCVLATITLVSLLLYWLMPALDKTDGVADKLRYCLLVFGVGVSASLTLSLGLIILVYYLLLLAKEWWRPESAPSEVPKQTLPTTETMPPPTQPAGGEAPAAPGKLSNGESSAIPFEPGEAANGVVPNSPSHEDDKN